MFFIGLVRLILRNDRISHSAELPTRCNFCCRFLDNHLFKVLHARLNWRYVTRILWPCRPTARDRHCFLRHSDRLRNLRRVLFILQLFKRAYHCRYHFHGYFEKYCNSSTSYILRYCVETHEAGPVN